MIIKNKRTSWFYFKKEIKIIIYPEGGITQSIFNNTRAQKIKFSNRASSSKHLSKRNTQGEGVDNSIKFYYTGHNVN